MNLPAWKLPPGVYRGTWDYLQSDTIAAEYDAKLADSPLLKFDKRFIQDFLPPISPTQPHPRIADFGCGTGRISRLLSPLGYSMLNIDLSQSMLNILRERCQHPELNESIQANLVELDFLQPHSLDMGLCLFSSLGMIQGRVHRRQFLTHVCGAMRPNAPFIVHVHNRYHSLWHPSGPSWLLRTWIKSTLENHWEFGDRIFVDLGIPSMFLHIYSRRELVQDLRQAGFEQVEICPINVAGDRLLKDGPISTLRAGGFFAVARRS